jgi:hypothetical protein
MLTVVFILAQTGSPASQSSTSADIDVTLAGRHLTIPLAYFASGNEPDLRDEPHLLILRVYLPDFTTHETRAPSDGGGFAEQVEIVLTRGERSLNTVYAFAAADRISSEPIRNAYGLRTFRTALDQGDPAARIHEVYFAARKDVVSTLIECEPLQPSPPCRQQLSIDGMSWKITYHRQYLPQWESIENRSVELVRGFIRDKQ